MTGWNGFSALRTRVAIPVVSVQITGRFCHAGHVFLEKRKPTVSALTVNCYYSFLRYCRCYFFIVIVIIILPLRAPSHFNLWILMLIFIMHNQRVSRFCIIQAYLGSFLLGNFKVVQVVALCSSFFLQHLSLQLLSYSCVDSEASLFCLYGLGMSGGYPFIEPLSLLVAPTLFTACWSFHLLRCLKLSS